MWPQRLLLAALLSLTILLTSIFFFTLHYSPGSSLHSSESSQELVPQPTELRLLIGILTRFGTIDRRHLLRLAYSVQPSPTFPAVIDVRFVLCNLTSSDQRLLVSLEILRFNDIIILNCSENMNSGKTYSYFSQLPAIFPDTEKYDYVMKTDDDTYIRVLPLVSSLRARPRHDLYYGFVVPCMSMDPFKGYMSGMGFVLSWDLVEWIRESEIPKNNTMGPEDKVVGEWLRLGSKGKNRWCEKPGMYDYPGTNGRCSHGLIEETVAVHRLKRMDMWVRVFEYFNVTKGVKPSRMYHLD
ncbi:hypothetical protein AMTRI_Chr09g14240 [Amborella trichopoda]|uniref:Hexosyltransferase n=1 Tax=Amborella trichopoda TaxID=13333 RepID=U5CV58_AMBTC|nr:beta-1,3-galactosyltransferase sqv-2 [Amborella trichopoda]ERN17206.1 hypothetical protein AMTR_s00044p00162820 [Amborella trichopoda]|eukprot:XP_006855739.1 beta-1,3-galactosyltransferase sqv-2 [Amborella trichopoda]